ANILLERRKEFAFEGMRFHDLARRGMSIPLVDAINQSHGGPAYGNFKFAYPIPAGEVDVNSNVVQNQGY
ncbi:MAG: RagB/SusD family nutrient uptake outer membrane protein, partial [Polaribacter sp.]|nr:RagB/SusD family nutrient uptake outer membrane protein [Polaribacter sp.]